MLQPPQLPALPPRPTASYVNKESMTAIGIIYPTLALMFLGLRLYGFWWHSSRGVTLDDLFVAPAALLNVAAGVAVAVGAQMDIMGGHSYPSVTVPEQLKLGKFEYAFWIGHVLAIGFIKFTLLFLFRSLFRGQAGRSAFDIANWTLIILVTLWTVAFVFLEILACGNRPSASWESFDSLRTKCMDTFALQLACAVISWILDLAIFIEPLVMIRTLNMKFRRKIQASVVFLFSFFAVISGLLRMIPWAQVYTQGTTKPFIRILDTDLSILDQQGVVSIVLFWTYTEIGIGFVIACIPRSAWIFDKISVDALGPLFAKLRSFTSLTSLPGRSTRSKVEVDQTAGHAWGAEMAEASQRDLISVLPLVLPPKTSYTLPSSCDDIPLAEMP
ncbi:hypothetical protein MFIFM68171_08728 [Madurella fahalii]|uniref:Rhodopsin domain-containing protein n=1 Tax=Madurella fahalii TaxID=1157608 RepID=A0ABQ0GL64_9PEZI